MTSSSIADARFSEFTLALLEGSGWYKANYKYAEEMTYGKNKGCEFLDAPCVDKKTKEVAFEEFCYPLNSVKTTWTGRGVGVCGVNSVKRNVFAENNYWGDRTSVLDPFSDNCPLLNMYQNKDCEDKSLHENAFLKDFEYYGYGGTGFLGTFYMGDELSEPYGFCFKSNVRRD